jgi:hypothetical protein
MSRLNSASLAPVGSAPIEETRRLYVTGESRNAHVRRSNCVARLSRLERLMGLHKVRSACDATRAIAVTGLFVTIALLSGTLTSVGGSHSSLAMGEAAGVSPEESRPASPPNGNLSIAIPQPYNPVIPGMYLMDELKVGVDPSPTQVLPPDFSVWIPQTIGLFSLSNSSVKVIGPALMTNLTPAGAAVPTIINSSVLVRPTGTFNASMPALLTSQLLAFMTNAPSDSFTLAVSWRWAIALPDGSTSFGPWSAATTVTPAEYAHLASYGPVTIAQHGWFQVCVSDSVISRVLSLHLETIAPVDDFVQVEQNISANSSQPVCWSAQVAAWVTPQPILAHVWAYDQKTFLLYLIKITVVSSTQPLEVLSSILTWNGIATIVALVAAAGLLCWGIRARVRGGSKGSSNV